MLILYTKPSSHAMKYNPNFLSTDFKTYLKNQKLSDSTIRYYSSDVRVFLRFIYQTTGEYEITSEVFESYENYLKSGRLPRKTINRKLSSLRIFNSFLVTTGILHDNMMKKIKNSSKAYSSSRVLAPQMIIVFIAIVLIGGFFFSQINVNTKKINPKESVNTVAIPSTLRTNATTVPETLDGRNLHEITIESDDVATLSPKTFGTDFIQAGSTTKTIYNPSISKEQSLVFITPTSAHDNYYYITQTNGAFTITLSKSLKTNFSFNWMIISNQIPVDMLPK